MGLHRSKIPLWVLDGSRFALDFVNNRYAKQGILVPATSLLSVTNDAGYGENSERGLVSFSGNTLKRTNRGLLLGAGRTNLCLQSQVMGTTWGLDHATQSANTTVGPDGTTTADSILETATTAQHGFSQQTFAVGAGNVFTYSLDLKYLGRQYCTFYIQPSDDFAGAAAAEFDLLNGVLTSYTPSSYGDEQQLNKGAGIFPLANGFYRCWFSCAITSAASVWAIYPHNTPNNANESYAGDTAKGVVATNGMVVAGLGPPPAPITTTTASVTKAADAVTLTDPTLIDSAQGTFYAEWIDRGPRQSEKWIVCARQDGTHKFGIRVTSGDKPEGAYLNAATEGNCIADAIVGADRILRAAFSYKVNDCSAAFSPGLKAAIVNDTSMTPATVSHSAVGIGQDGNGAAFLDGYLRFLSWSPNRDSDAKLLAWAQTA